MEPRVPSECRSANTLNVGGTGNTSIAGVIFGSGGLTKDGSGILTLAGADTFGGNIAVNSGMLRLGANNVVPNAASVSLAAGATLDLNGKTDTFTGLSGSGTLWMNGGDLTLLGANTLAGVQFFQREDCGSESSASLSRLLCSRIS